MRWGCRRIDSRSCVRGRPAVSRARGPRAFSGALRLNQRQVLLLIAVALAGCGGSPIRTGDTIDGAAGRLLVTPASPSHWEPFLFPGKRFAAFEPDEVMQRPALRVRAHSSVSILRQRFEPGLAGVGRLSFSWRVDGLPEGADLQQAALADSPVRVVLAFDGDRSGWSPRMHRLSELSRLLSGEELPYATLVYVWGNQETVGSVVTNSRTDRIRKLVLDSGTQHLGQWRDHVRDVRSDFRRAFGKEPGPLRALALMTDTDNTRSRLTAWYGPLRLELAGD